MEKKRYSLKIDLSQQKVYLQSGSTEISNYEISTAKNGAGEKIDSECTPRGRHVIVEKFGEDCPLNTIFVGREPTGEIFNHEMYQQHPGRDWMLTRILRLEGAEPGRNKGGDVDTFNRMIYIHGTHDEVKMGIVGSHGCIRMHNADVIYLFNILAHGDIVDIVE